MRCPITAAAGLAATILISFPFAAPSFAQETTTPPVLSYIDSLLAQADRIAQATGSDRDMALATALLGEAVRANNTLAMRRLAGILAAGDGVPADPARAEALLEQAIAAGDVKWAALQLGDLYRADTPLRDPHKAAAAFEQAVAAGNTTAMRRLAAMSLRGEGVARDPQRAEALLKQAVAAGDVKWGALDLGDFYRADTPFRSLPEAAKAYELSAKAENPASMVKLAALLTAGDGVPLDLPTAGTWLETALAAGAARDAGFALGNLYSRSDFPGQDPARARDFYDQAAAAGNTQAALVLIRLAGQDVTQPDELAKAIDYARAAAKGVGRDRVVDQLVKLPAPALVGLVQIELVKAGESVRVDGDHGKQTVTAITRYCKRQGITDCNPRLITRPFLEAIILGPATG